jgi:thiol-disulfide isomerase/thioredoxin
MFMVIDEALARRMLPVVAILMVVFLVAGFVQQLPRDETTTAPTPTQQAPVASSTPAPMLTFVAPNVAPTPAATRELAPYPVYGPAAELRTDVWLNSDTSPRLADLRGRVVLLMFWGFLCPPCMPLLPNVNDWHDTYADQGLTVIGIHTPNVPPERNFERLTEALEEFGIAYPVAQDNDLLTWRSYGQEVWPTIYLIDKRGYLRYQQVGEGGYATTEAAIQALLTESS